ncbi:MAG TPA: hypothetical protein DEF51_08255 [Myxococcales bacterium]|nr:hypothetical protein [Myxococcales bacterium]
MGAWIGRGGEAGQERLEDRARLDGQLRRGLPIAREPRRVRERLAEVIGRARGGLTELGSAGYPGAARPAPLPGRRVASPPPRRLLHPAA